MTRASRAMMAGAGVGAGLDLGRGRVRAVGVGGLEVLAPAIDQWFGFLVGGEGVVSLLPPWKGKNSCVCMKTNGVGRTRLSLLGDPP
jgi:hypothetical protein